MLTPEKVNAAVAAARAKSAVQLRFSPAATADELNRVREIVAGSPGAQPVQLLFERVGREPLQVEAGPEFNVALTRDLEQELARWLVTAKADKSHLAA